MTLWLTGDADADALLDADPFALLAGMLLDQQVAMETAFAGPAKVRDRLAAAAGNPGNPNSPENPDSRLDPRAVADADPETFTELMRTPPAVHRYPGSMGARLQALARAVVDDWDGDATAIWTRPERDGDAAPDGRTVLRRLKALPGFGDQKARIFLALLGKQRGLEAPGWREAAGAYGEEGSFRSAADIVDEDSLTKVRETKRAAKAAAKKKS